MFELSQDQDITTLRMSHGKVNAMSLEFCETLTQHLKTLQTQSCRAVILIGNSRVFSAGVDLIRLIEEPVDYLDRFLPALCEMFETVFSFPRPLVALVSGHAVAGGCVLACASDYRVIESQAHIGVPELRVGVPFPAAGLEIMRWAANQAAFQQIISAGATFTGPAAVDVGLADESVDHDSLLEAGQQAVERLLTVPPEIFELTKRQMRLPVIDRIARCQETFGSEIDRLWRSPNTRATVTRYVEERLKKPSAKNV